MLFVAVVVAIACSSSLRLVPAVGLVVEFVRCAFTRFPVCARIAALVPADATPAPFHLRGSTESLCLYSTRGMFRNNLPRKDSALRPLFIIDCLPAS